MRCWFLWFFYIQGFAVVISGLQNAFGQHSIDLVIIDHENNSIVRGFLRTGYHFNWLRDRSGLDWRLFRVDRRIKGAVKLALQRDSDRRAYCLEEPISQPFS